MDGIEAEVRISRPSVAYDRHSTFANVCSLQFVGLYTQTGAETLVVQIRPEPENFSNKSRVYFTAKGTSTGIRER